MKQFFMGKHILLGVTGGIAAYKSADLVRRLREVGAEVRVVMTEGAKQFITPLTMQAVSGNPVHDDLFDLEAEAAMGHIELARWADLILIAPATADFMAQLNHGEARDLLTTLCLASKAPIAIAPAMNQGMWKNKATQENLQALQKKAIAIFGPGEGDQACGDVGPGRMLEPLELVERAAEIFATGRLAGKSVLITMGPTREAIDPVRYISNASSGKMGHAMAAAALEAGARVTVVSGPVNLPRLSRVKYIDVMSAEEMFAAVMANSDDNHIFIGVAAVADYRCKKPALQKIKKTANEFLTLELERNPDILASVSQLKQRPFVVGFAAETENLLDYAQAKLVNKQLDMLVANLVEDSIDQEENSVTVLLKDDKKEFPRMSKTKLARELVELIARMYKPVG